MKIPLNFHDLIYPRASADTQDDFTGVSTRIHQTSVLSHLHVFAAYFPVSPYSVSAFLFPKMNSQLQLASCDSRQNQASIDVSNNFSHQPFLNSDLQISHSTSRKREHLIFKRLQITKEFSDRDEIKNGECSPEDPEYQYLSFCLSTNLKLKNEHKIFIKATCNISLLNVNITKCASKGLTELTQESIEENVIALLALFKRELRKGSVKKNCFFLDSVMTYMLSKSSQECSAEQTEQKRLTGGISTKCKPEFTYSILVFN